MKSRIFKFQQEIENCALVENPVDLLYLTGLSLSRGLLVATKEEVVLFVDGRYFAVAERQAPCPVRLLVGNAVTDWLEAKGIKTLEFDSAFTTVDRHEVMKKQVAELRGTSGLLKKLRAIKDENEVAALKKAAHITMCGFKHVESLLKEGISEEELALEFEFFVRKAGATSLSFDPIVAFGENSAYPHYRAGKAKLKKNQIVLIDVGAVVDRYSGDLTRVVFFGKPDPELEKMLMLTKKAQKKAIEAVRIGAKFEDLDKAARAVFAEAGVEELFTHSLGHGIGLETHEFPRIILGTEDKIEAGMAFTIEPGLYRPGLGGVRWEDVVYT